MSLYAQRGVSAQKEEVLAATKGLDAGLYPRAFCKVYPDLLGGDEQWVSVMHADGAGTKSILAYLYWKETGDLSVWKGIAQDAIIMNIDDLLCIGIHDRLLFSSSIDRNKNRIPGEVLHAIIEGTEECLQLLRDHGLGILFAGGETADVGDVVRTVAVNGTVAARWPKARLVTNEDIRPGQVIIGVASYGKAVYEQEYNSGIGSNGLTSARHDLLQRHYAVAFPESFDGDLDRKVVYIGKHRLTDPYTHTFSGREYRTDIGRLVLSPTRTYAPLIARIMKSSFSAVRGLIHCSGGGQTKCLKYMPEGVHLVKDNLFDPPPVFGLIREAAGADDREMYQVFNMGCRLEIYTEESAAPEMLAAAEALGLEARVIGRVEAGSGRSLSIVLPGGSVTYSA